MLINSKMPLPLMSGRFASGNSKEYLEHIMDSETKALALCERHYYRGEGEACYAIASELVKSETGVIRISALLMTGFGALCMGDSQKALGIINAMHSAYLEKTAEEYKYTQEEAQLVVLINNLSVTLIHLEGIETLPLALHSLPMGIQLIALYASAHKAYLDGAYGEAIGIAKTALSLKDGSYPVGDIYIHLVLAMCYISQKELEAANKHFLTAWEIAKPERFYEPFAEHHGLIGGMVEVHLKKQEPEAYDAITTQVYRFAQAWRDIHNPHNGAKVTDELTTTELTVAMLANKGWNNEQIAAHLSISINTVKYVIKQIYKKLKISSRSELERYMLK